MVMKLKCISDFGWLRLGGHVLDKQKTLSIHLPFIHVYHTGFLNGSGDGMMSLPPDFFRRIKKYWLSVDTWSDCELPQSWMLPMPWERHGKIHIFNGTAYFVDHKMIWVETIRLQQPILTVTDLQQKLRLLISIIEQDEHLKIDIKKQLGMNQMLYGI